MNYTRQYSSRLHSSSQVNTNQKITIQKPLVGTVKKLVNQFEALKTNGVSDSVGPEKSYKSVFKIKLTSPYKSISPAKLGDSTSHLHCQRQNNLTIAAESASAIHSRSEPDSPESGKYIAYLVKVVPEGNETTTTVPNAANQSNSDTNLTEFVAEDEASAAAAPAENKTDYSDEIKEILKDSKIDINEIEKIKLDINEIEMLQIDLSEQLRKAKLFNFKYNDILKVNAISRWNDRIKNIYQKHLCYSYELKSYTDSIKNGFLLVDSLLDFSSTESTKELAKTILSLNCLYREHYNQLVERFRIQAEEEAKKKAKAKVE